MSLCAAQKTQNPPLAPVKRGREVGGESPFEGRYSSHQKLAVMCSGWKARATESHSGTVAQGHSGEGAVLRGGGCDDHFHFAAICQA